MNANSRHTWKSIVAMTGLLGLFLSSTGCLHREATAESGSDGETASWVDPAIQVPAGTPIEVRLTSRISSEEASEGDAWTGVVVEPVIADDKVVFAPGSGVQGTVTSVIPAKRGERAMIDLRVDRVDTHAVPATTEPVIAGSPRARNLGAIAGSAAAGALIGKAVGGDGKDAAIGGLIGGAAATGAVAASKGYQVVLKTGTVMTFTTDAQVAVR